MKQKKFFIGLASIVAALGFTACSNDDTDYQQSLSRGNVISLTSQLQTMRSTTDPQAGTSLSTSSALAVFAMNGTTALEKGNNEQYTVNASGIMSPVTSSHLMVWPGEALNFYAYAPYNSEYTYNGLNSFSVKTDQSTEADYLASDLVLAQAATAADYDTSTPVALQFKHQMAKINVTINKAAGATVDLSKAKVSIINTQITTTFKPNATNTGDDKVLGEASGDATDIVIVSALGEATTAVGIIVPQTIAAGKGLVKIQTNPGESDNRTLIAKLGEEVVFASGEQYSFTAVVNNPEAPVTYITLKPGSVNLVAWNDNNLGASTAEYNIGDYICKDGSLLRSSEVTNENKANIVAVIFSNQVSSADAEAGYDGYAMSIVEMTGRKWLTGDAIESAPANFAAAYNDLNGRTKTATLQGTTGWESTATDYAISIVNYTNLGNSIDEGAIVGAAVDGRKNLSGWFTPSIGQMIQILNGLGRAGITSTLAIQNSDWTKGNGDYYTNETSTALSTIDGYITSLGKSALFGNGYVFSTVTENENNFFYVKVTDANKHFSLGKTASKTSQATRRVIPCLAFKLQ